MLTVSISASDVAFNSRGNRKCGCNDRWPESEPDNQSENSSLLPHREEATVPVAVHEAKTSAMWFSLDPFKRQRS